MLKKNISYIFLCCCIFICLILILFGFRARFQPNTPTKANNESIPEYHYFLKEYQGKIAVYTSTGEKPKRILDVYLNTLPQADIERLKEGIPITDEDQLEEFIQDFDS